MSIIQIKINNASIFFAKFPNIVHFSLKILQTDYFILKNDNAKMLDTITLEG